jgi:hypothetical protein
LKCNTVRDFPEFFDIDGSDHHEFVPPGQSEEDVRYSSEETARQVAGTWFLHHANAPNHTSLVVQQFLTKKNIPIITKPPYSPDLAPSDFWLFPTHFATTEDIRANLTAELWIIPKEVFC